MGKIHFTVHDDRSDGKMHVLYRSPREKGEFITEDAAMVDQAFCKCLGLVKEAIPKHAIDPDTGAPLVAVYVAADADGNPLDPAPAGLDEETDPGPVPLGYH